MRWTNPTDAQRAEFAAWIAERPDHVRAVAERFDPWTMYRLTTTGQRCRVIGFHESEGPTPVTLYIYAEHPTLGEITGRNVFGIEPETVVPWTEADEPEPLKGDRGQRLVVTHIDYATGTITVGDNE